MPSFDVIEKQLTSNDPDVKIVGIDKLKQILEDGVDNELYKYVAKDEIMDLLVPCIKASIINVCIKSLEILPLILNNIILNKKPLKSYFSIFTSILIDRLTDSKERIREANVDTLILIWLELNNGLQNNDGPYLNGLNKAKDEFFKSLILLGLKHKNWRVREQILNCIIQCSIRSKDFPLYKFTTTVLSLVEDPNEAVRENAKKILLDHFPIHSKEASNSLSLNLNKVRLKKAFLEQLNQRLINNAKEEEPTLKNETLNNLKSKSLSKKSSAEDEIPDGLKGLFDAHELSRSTTENLTSSSLTSISKKSSNNNLESSSTHSIGLNLPNDIEIIDPTDVYDENDLNTHLNNITKAFSGKETDINWDLRDKNLLIFRKILRGNSLTNHLEAILNFLKEIIEPINTTMLSVRTTLSISAFNTIFDLSFFLPDGSLDTYSFLIFPTLLKCSSSSKKLIAEAAYTTTNKFLAHTSYSLKTLSLICKAMEDRSTNLRSYSANYLLVFLKKHAIVRPRIFEKKGLLVGKDLVVKAINKGLLDATTKTRDLTRQVFWLFSSIWPNDAKEMLNSYDPSVKKQLLKEDPKNGGVALSRESSISIGSTTSSNGSKRNTIISARPPSSIPNRSSIISRSGSSQSLNSRIAPRPSTSMGRFNTTKNTINTLITHNEMKIQTQRNINPLTRTTATNTTIKETISNIDKEPHKLRPMSMAAPTKSISTTKTNNGIINKADSNTISRLKSNINPSVTTNRRSMVSMHANTQTLRKKEEIPAKLSITPTNSSRSVNSSLSKRTSLNYIRSGIQKADSSDTFVSRIPKPGFSTLLRNEGKLPGITHNMPLSTSSLKPLTPSNGSIKSRPKSVAAFVSNSSLSNSNNLEGSNKKDINTIKRNGRPATFLLKEDVKLDLDKYKDIESSKSNTISMPSQVRSKTSIGNNLGEYENISGIANLKFPLTRNNSKLKSASEEYNLNSIVEESDNEINNDINNDSNNNDINIDKHVKFSLNENKFYENGESSNGYKDNSVDENSEVSSDKSKGGENDLIKKEKSTDERIQILTKLIDKVRPVNKASSSDFLKLDHFSKETPTSTNLDWEVIWKKNSNFDRLIKISVRSIQLPNMPWEFKLPYIHLLNNLITYQSPLSNIYASEIFSILIDCRKNTPREIDSASEDALIAFSKYLDLNKCLLICIRWLQACLLITKGSIPDIEDLSIPITSGFMVLTKSVSRAVKEDLDLIQPDLNSLVSSGFIHFSSEVRRHALFLVLAVKEQLGSDINILHFFPKLTPSQLNLIQLYEESY